ncbi:helix-turn-helix domain-containing protein [Chitinophaga pendula]|uniref:ArsR/SmtB family transcription factor n=1 Tax=Chitinophaga TaxID=79328 RepID=UPI000BB0BD04|nr:MULTISPECIES: metalloregulator ArsR/SmtB family transcription factor [Chitinophaga]ASZ12785.1 transcriptional regulator [Chitinophaga sp. MD30]UCJ09594.1 helix-turn-helix domain-containing protein [Chitinophaga pendula]
MELITVFKALSNETRINILIWLKEPRLHFPAEELLDYDPNLGVCVSDITQKTGLSPSTTSDYLSLLQKCGLIEATRVGQWTYYKRNEAAINTLNKLIKKAF